MAWLHDLRNDVQEVLEFVASEIPCTCPWVRTEEHAGMRCPAHRAHTALGALYRHGTPTRRFRRALTPRWIPAHSVLVAHEWIVRDIGHGARERHHDFRNCRIWCGDCGAVAPGGCHGTPVQRGDVLYWWGDYSWSDSLARDLEDAKPCVELIGRLFELRPAPPPDLPRSALPEEYDRLQWDLLDDVGTRPPELPRVGFGSRDGLAGLAREDRGLPEGQHRRPS